MNAENTHQVFDWLWTSGQLSVRDIAELPALGVGTVINLALPTSSNALPGEAELVTVHGINYIHIPVVWEAPQLEDLSTFFAILDALNALNGKNVWVHCAKNMRVSTFVYLYRKLRLDEPEEQARFPMQEVWTPNATWQKFIDQALASKLGRSHLLNV
jgi:protein tyrosine phosphatase (PTP) superfamily phosphohydrolase (DUF442 family)